MKTLDEKCMSLYNKYKCILNAFLYIKESNNLYNSIISVSLLQL